MIIASSALIFFIFIKKTRSILFCSNNADGFLRVFLLYLTISGYLFCFSFLFADLFYLACFFLFFICPAFYLSCFLRDKKGNFLPLSERFFRLSPLLSFPKLPASLSPSRLCRLISPSLPSSRFPSVRFRRFVSLLLPSS